MKSTLVKGLILTFIVWAMVMSSVITQVDAREHPKSAPVPPGIKNPLMRAPALKSGPVAEESEYRPSTVGASKVAGAREAYGKVPLSFEPNLGQVDSPASFLCHNGAYNLYLMRNEVVFAFKQPLSRSDKLPLPGSDEAQTGRSETLVKMTLLGANPNPQLKGFDVLPGKTNYISGNDSARWHTNIPNYARVSYSEVYPGIDLVYFGKQRQLEYDFVIAPGADPGVIRLKFSGTRDISINSGGDLIVQTSAGEIRQLNPVVYQEINGTKHYVDGRYELTPTNEVAFKIAKYDSSKSLIIDPVFIYSTYFGTTGEDVAYSIAVDGAGSSYITGYSFGQGQRVFVAKLNPAGNALSYLTYLSGTTGNNVGYQIAVDIHGSAVLTGYTTASNFPTAGAFQTIRKGWANAFVTRLTPAGLLSSSTYLGGTDQITGHGDFGTGIALDSAGNVYVTGETTSIDFPVLNAYQPSKGGLRDSFLVKLTPSLSALMFGTYLGGSSTEGGNPIADSVNTNPGNRIVVDSNGACYLTGFTFSANFPVTTNALQSSKHGESDAYIAKFTTNGVPVFITYLGGTGTGNDFAHGDYAYGIAVDSLQNVYVVGDTTSNDLATSNAFQRTKNGPRDAFLVKVNAQGSAIVYATYLGGSHSTDHAFGVAVDAAGNAYVIGVTESTDFPVGNLLQPTKGAGKDAFLCKVNTTGTALVYSSYIGGNGGDSGSAVAVDEVGNAFVAGWTVSSDFPRTNPMQPTLGGQFDAFVAKIDSTVFSVIAIEAKKGGNRGEVSATIVGGGFEPGSTIKLKAANTTDIEGANPNFIDSSHLAATFNLREATVGPRDVVVTLPDGRTAKLQNGFTVEGGGQSEVWSSVLGRDTIRTGRKELFTLVYGNRGNINAYGVLLWIGGIPKDAEVTFGRPLASPEPRPGQEAIDWNQIPVFTESNNEKVLPFFVPVLQPGTSSINISIRMPTTGNFQLRSWVNRPLFETRSDFSSGLSQSGFKSLRATMEAANASRLDIVSCLGQVGGAVMRFPEGWDCLFQNLAFDLEVLTMQYETHLGLEPDLESATWEFTQIFIQCSEFSGDRLAKAKELAFDFINLERAVYSEECSRTFNHLLDSFLAVRTVTSRDPNDKIGLRGSGPQQFISGNQTTSFVIRYENIETATAAAQGVGITDQLDIETFDLSTVRFGPIIIGNRQLTPAPASSEFIGTLDLRPTNNLIVKVVAGLNKDTGLITWKFTSLDPATGLPTNDPLAGFLPPNPSPPEGEGGVFFTVSPKAGLPTGTEILNQASIVFDDNAAILTPTWLNTLDNSTPTSHVLPLPATQSSAGFNVQWSGADSGAGIKDYTIFVSENGGPYNVWLANVAATQGDFNGQAGVNYSFFSIARDATGNVEPAKTTGEASTLVVIGADLSIADEVTSNTILTGSNITYFITVNNLGPGTASSVRITDNLPASTTFISCSATGGQVCAGSGNTRTVDFPTLAPNSSATVTLVATLDCSTSDGAAIANVATVSSAINDPNLNDNSATASIRAVNPSPAIACPTDITQSNDPGKGSAVVNYTTPIATDNCSGVAVSCSSPGGATFPVGVTQVTCIASDSGGGQSACSFTVTVNDTEAPVISTCAAGRTLTTNGNAQVSLPDLRPEIIATDNQTPASALTITQSPAPGTMVGAGITTVEITVRDAANNASSCSATVIVSRFSTQDFVVFASERIKLGANAKVITGSIGANTSLPDRNGSPDDKEEVVLGESVRLVQAGSSVVGDTVKLHAHAQIFNVFYNELVNTRGDILGLRFTPVSLPVIALPTLPLISPGSQDIEVQSNQTKTLAPGRYRRITVKNRGTLILTGGIYELESLDVRREANVRFKGPAEVRIKNEVDTDLGSYLGPDASAATLMASQIVFYAEGLDDRGRHHDEDQELTPTVVQIGQRNTVLANIYAPNGTVWLKSDTKATGAFIGRRARIGERVELKLASAF